ncbi:hypothetical protein KI688_010659 [Linnemannia hyalina]|uniref:Uncharacterized protein n=1 Tax=Linnemannia hyalina TaxID=64524 RepID=A0A9P7XWG6_9FUNG|nr:hypothetical protein KI688_010659 [Linnemannia hyalina]
MSLTQLSQHRFIAGGENPAQCFQRYGQPLSQLCYALVETDPDGIQFVRWSKIQQLYDREGKVKFVVDGNDHVPLAVGPDMQIIVPWRIQAFLNKTLQVALNDEQPGCLDPKTPADVHPIATTDENVESAKTKSATDDNSDIESTMDHDSSSFPNLAPFSVVVSSHRRASTYPITSGLEARVNQSLLEPHDATPKGPALQSFRSVYILDAFGNPAPPSVSININARFDNQLQHHIVLWNDILRVFRNVLYIQADGALVSFLTNDNFGDLMCLRIAHHQESNSTSTNTTTYCDSYFRSGASEHSPNSDSTVAHIHTHNNNNNNINGNNLFTSGHQRIYSNATHRHSHGASTSSTDDQEKMGQARNIAQAVTEGTPSSPTQPTRSSHTQARCDSSKHAQALVTPITGTKTTAAATIAGSRPISMKLAAPAATARPAHRHDSIPRTSTKHPRKPRTGSRATDKFRFFWMCEFVDPAQTPVMGGGVGGLAPHVGHHGGYDLVHPEEFFRKHRAALLLNLQMFKFSTKRTSTAVVNGGGGNKGELSIYNQGIAFLHMSMKLGWEEIELYLDLMISHLEQLSSKVTDKIQDSQKAGGRGGQEQLPILSDKELKSIQSYLIATTSTDSGIDQLHNQYRYVDSQGHCNGSA